MKKEEVFLEQINSKIEKFDSDSSNHKKLHRTFRYFIFIFAAVTSVFSGLALSFPEVQTNLNIMILLIGAASGIITSIEGLRRPFDLWIMERNLYYSLLDLKEDFEYQATDNGKINIDDYHIKMQEILNASKEKWVKKIKLEKEKIDNSSN